MRLTWALAAAVAMCVGFGAGLSACGNDCAEGQRNICNEEYEDCFCGDPCSSHAGCDARSFCEQQILHGVCVPLQYASTTCATGQCIGGLCDGYECHPFCESDGDCPGGCCGLTEGYVGGELRQVPICTSDCNGTN